MNRTQLSLRVRSLTRDLSNSIFRESDIVDYINEGIDRLVQIIPSLSGLVRLSASSDEPNLLPQNYHHLLSLYSASRCFTQDERHYQATNFMNEFEAKVEELRMKIETGEVLISDGEGNAVKPPNNNDYVSDIYFTK